MTLRRKNMLAKSAFPYKTPTAFTYDCADARTLLTTALEAADWNKFAARFIVFDAHITLSEQ